MARIALQYEVPERLYLLGVEWEMADRESIVQTVRLDPHATIRDLAMRLRAFADHLAREAEEHPEVTHA